MKRIKLAVSIISLSLTLFVLVFGITGAFSALKIDYNENITVIYFSSLELKYKVNNVIIKIQYVQKNSTTILMSVYDFPFENTEDGNYGLVNQLQRTYNGEKQGVGAWQIEGTNKIITNDTIITASLVLEPVWYSYDNSLTSAWTITSDGQITPSATTKQKNKILVPYEVNGIVVKSMPDNIFSSNRTLNSIIIPKTVTDVGSYAFSNCNALKDVTLLGGVLTIKEGTFSNCSLLSNVLLPIGLQTIESWVFEGCFALQQITLPSTVQVIKMGAFFYCTGLTNILLSNDLKYIEDWAFESCSSLLSIIFPSALQTIGGGAFYGCSSLTTIYVQRQATINFNGTILQDSATNVFYDAPAALKVYVPNDVSLSFYQNAQNWKSFSANKFAVGNPNN